MIDEREKPVLAALDALGIEFKRFAHPAAATMEECEAVAKLAGAAHCKNLFLTNRRESVFYLVMIGANKRFRTANISKQLSVPRLSFASEELLLRHLGLTQGSISVTGLINDAEHAVRVAIDRDILAEEKLLIHPNINTASLLVSTADIGKFLSSLGYEYRELDVPELEDAENQ